jgi:hypothetical protein
MWGIVPVNVPFVFNNKNFFVGEMPPVLAK